MIPREILKKIRQIEIRTNRLVSETLAGQYHSVFKGQGMNFEEVREYQPGDEVRSIDWNVTARMNHPFVKKFVEERELTVMLVVDVSASGEFGSVHLSKRELAAEVGDHLGGQLLADLGQRREPVVLREHLQQILAVAAREQLAHSGLRTGVGAQHHREAAVLHVAVRQVGSASGLGEARVVVE